MYEIENIFGIFIAGSITALIIAFIVRVLLDRRDASNVVAGNPYTRKFHVFEEAILPGAENTSDFTPIKKQLKQKGFRVVSSIDVLAASSRPWVNWPLFVVVTREQGFTIRVFDRFLQPVMVDFIKRRFQRRAIELVELLKGTVEHHNSPDQHKPAPSAGR